MSKVKDNLRKGQGNSKINGISKQYKVSSSGNISAGDFIKLIQPETTAVSINKVKSGEVEVNTNGIYNGEYQIQKFIYDSTTVDTIVNTDEIVAAPLNDNKALIVYRDPDNDMAGTAMIATITDGNIKYSDRFVFNPNSISNINLTVLDTNKVLVMFSNQSNNSCGTASILAIEDNNIEVRDSIIYNNSATSLSKGITLTKGEVLIVFVDDDNNSSGSSILINISDNDSIILSNKVMFCLDSINYLDIAKLSDNKALLVYSSNNTYNGNVNVIDISYNSINIGPTHSLNLDNMTEEEQDISFISVASIDNINAVIAYRKTLIDENDHDYYAIVTVNIDGSNVKFGSKKVLNTNACNLPIEVNVMNNNDVITVYQSFENGDYYLNVSIVSIDSTNIISDNIFTTVLSNHPINNTLCGINFNKYKCMVLTKSELDNFSNFECYTIEMTPTTSHNEYTRNIENTDINYRKSISGDFADIDTIIIDKKIVMVPYIQPKGWDVEGKQTFADGKYYLIYTDDENKPLLEWNEISEIFEPDMNINSINGILLRKNKVLLVYTDNDNSNSKYAIININKDSNEDVKLNIVNKDIFTDNDIYVNNGSLAKLDDNRILSVYRTESDYSVRAKIMIVGSDDSISFTDEYILDTATSDTLPISMSAVTIANNKIYVTYLLGQDTNVVTGKLLLVDEKNNITTIDKSFTIDKATNIYENRLMYLEPNTVIHSSEILINEEESSNTYDVTVDDINVSSLSAGAVINCPYTGSSKELELPAGRYKLECWGAQGGYGENILSSDDSECIGGLGGYSTGIIYLTESTKLYLYSGGQGKYIPIDEETGNSIVAGGGFNGGGPARICKDASNNLVGGASGGGGTDIRIGVDSLYARAIVAGGGSGISHNVYTSYDSDGSDIILIDNYNGRYGGGILGEGDNLAGEQTKGGYNPEYLDGNGSFGKASQYIYNKEQYGQTGAGGGWYSGANTIAPSHMYENYNDMSIIRSGGGSGYVYNEDTVSNYPKGCLLTSNYYLENSKTIDGSSTNPFIDPESGKSVNGRSGNGYIRITVLESDYENDHPNRFGNTTLIRFDGEKLSIHDNASLLPPDTAGISDINVLKIDKDLDKTLIYATYKHLSKDTGRINPLVVPGNISLNFDKNNQYQMSFIGTNNTFKHDDSYDTLRYSTALLNKDLIISAKTNRLVDDSKENHASTLELQTFKVQNIGNIDLEKFDIVDTNSKYITNNTSGLVDYISTQGIRIDTNRILVISSINSNNVYSGICQIYNIAGDKKDIIARSDVFEFSTIKTNNINAIMIDEDKVLISFNTSTSTAAGACYAIVGTIGDNTITFGELIEFSEYDFYRSNLILLSTNKVLLNIGNTIKIISAEYDNSISILTSLEITNDSIGIGGLEESNHCPKNIIQLNNNKLLLTYAITDICYCAIISVDNVNNIGISDREVFMNYDKIVQNGTKSINSILLDENKVLIGYMVNTDSSIHASVVTITESDSIKVGPREILAEYIDLKQNINLHKIDDKVLFTYLEPITDSEDCTIKYTLLSVEDNNINLGNLYSVEDITTVADFDNITSIDEDILLLYTKISNDNNIKCVILSNLVKNVFRYTEGCAIFEDSLDQSTFAPVIDYSPITDSIDEVAKCATSTKITDDKVLITYIDSFTKYGVARIANITNQSIEYGKSYTINNNPTSNIKTQLLDDGRILIVFTDDSDNNNAKFTIASINEDEISFTQSISRSLSEEYLKGNNLDMCILNDGRVFIAYPDGTFEIANINNNNILFELLNIFDTGILDNITVKAISDNKILLLYKGSGIVEDSALYSIKSMVIDVSDSANTVLGEIETVYKDDIDFEGTLSLIQTDYFKHKFLISINSIGYLSILSIDLDTLSVSISQTTVNFESKLSNTCISQINDTSYLLIYCDGFGANGIVLDINGSEITKINEYKFDNSSTITYLNGTYLVDNKIFIILDENVSDTTVASSSVLLFNIDENIVVKYDGIDKPHGIAKSDGLINGIIDVYVTGNVQQ